VLADYLSKFEARCDKKMKILKDKFNFQRKTEIREIEQRKNSQTNILIRCHKVAIVQSSRTTPTSHSTTWSYQLPQGVDVAWETHSTCPEWAPEPGGCVFSP
jgi:hypothetical protein